MGGWLAFLAKINGLRKQFLMFNQSGSDLTAVTRTRTTLPVMIGMVKVSRWPGWRPAEKNYRLASTGWLSHPAKAPVW
jgi:hypothetical protein